MYSTDAEKALPMTTSNYSRIRFIGYTIPTLRVGDHRQDQQRRQGV
jgi:hypothetical protein